LPAWRDDRNDQLDAGRVHRLHVRHHQALSATATSRRHPATAVGRREPCAQPVRRPGHLAEHASSDRADRPLPEPN
jgi:hypothetical protein